MFEDFIKNVIESARKEFERKREEETNLLMEEIMTFHEDKAIDEALAKKDKETFLILVGGNNND